MLFSLAYKWHVSAQIPEYGLIGVPNKAGINHALAKLKAAN